MFISKELLYLELHKTGCSHVLKLLSAIPSVTGTIVGKHNTIYEVPPSVLGDITTKLRVGNVRNPWDWYVSLWAFGCMGKGGLYGRVAPRGLWKKIRRPKSLAIDSKSWGEVYADANSPELFRRWLKLVLEKRRGDIGEGYGSARISSEIGLLTYRYLRLYTFDFDVQAPSFRSVDEVWEFDRKQNFIQFFIANEKLEQDFQSLMGKLRIAEAEYENLIRSPKTNTSVRKPFGDYYDAESMELVRRREKLVIEKHGYKS